MNHLRGTSGMQDSSMLTGCSHLLIVRCLPCYVAAPWLHRGLYQFVSGRDSRLNTTTTICDPEVPYYHVLHAFCQHLTIQLQRCDFNTQQCP